MDARDAFLICMITLGLGAFIVFRDPVVWTLSCLILVALIMRDIDRYLADAVRVGLWLHRRTEKDK